MVKFDTITKKFYEDNVERKITDERFMKMSISYKQGQNALKRQIAELENEIAVEKEKS